MFLDLFMTFLLHLDDPLVELGSLILIVIFFVHVTETTLIDEVLPVKAFSVRSNLAFFKVVIDIDLAFIKIELSFSDLLFSWLTWIQSELLCHLKDDTFLMIVVIKNSQILWSWSLIRCESHTSVH